MMKIIVIGIFYNLLLQNNAAGEPAVKIQLCSDIFYDVITKYQNQMEEDECKKHIGYFERYKNWMEFLFGKPSVRIPITSIKLDNSKGCQILSNSSLETTIEATIIYGEKSSSQNGKGKSKNRNNYLMLSMTINVILTIEVTGNSINFSVQDCGCYPKTVESNLNEDHELNLHEVRRLESRSCSMVRKMIANMNVHWKDCFSIDPSGSSTLLHKYSVQNNYCVVLYFDFRVGNSEVISEQTHTDLSGSCISILIEPCRDMTLNDLFMNMNKTLEDMLLSPEECNNLLVSKMEEPDYTTVKCHIIGPTTNHESNTITVEIQCGGFTLESGDKSVFEIVFEVDFTTSCIIDHEKMRPQFVQSGPPRILMSECHIGDSPDLHLENLKTFTKKMTNETVMPAMFASLKDYRTPMQNLTLLSKVSVTPTAYEIQLPTPKALQND